MVEHDLVCWGCCCWTKAHAWVDTVFKCGADCSGRFAVVGLSYDLAGLDLSLASLFAPSPGDALALRGEVG